MSGREIKKYIKKYENLSKDFECGNIIIDNFLKSGSALDKNQGITYVMLSEKENFLIGYYNIEVGRVDQIENVNGSDRYILMGGAININYLAIHSKYQGTQIAEYEGKKPKTPYYKDTMSVLLKILAIGTGKEDYNESTSIDELLEPRRFTLTEVLDLLIDDINVRIVDSNGNEIISGRVGNIIKSSVVRKDGKNEVIDIFDRYNVLNIEIAKEQ